MSLTLYQLVDAVEQVWGTSQDPRLNAVQTVNEAGRHLYAMHQWNWAKRPGVSLDTVADQNYIALPADFEAVLGIASANDLQYGITLTNAADIASRRGSVIPPSFCYWACLVQDDQATSEDAPPTPRLDLYPTPTTDSAATFLLTYRAKWRELDDDRDVPTYPRPTPACSSASCGRSHSKRSCPAATPSNALRSARPRGRSRPTTA
jgi:hypothetical protein